MNLLRAAAVSTAIVSSNAFAIFGIGGHWAPNFGSKTEANSEIIQTVNVPGFGEKSISFERGSAADLQGFGLKLWIDALPFVDLEATGNIQFGTYDANIKYPTIVDGQIVDAEQKLVPDLDVMGVKFEAKPFVSQFMGDLTIQYPIADVIPMIKPYVGAGVTYFYGTPLVEKSMVEGVAATVAESIENNSGTTPTEEEMLDLVTDALGGMEIQQTVGGHVMAGLKFEPVLIPFAIYANGKYYFGGIEDVTNGVVAEVGGALAF